MGMEELKSSPADVGLRRSTKKPSDARVMVIDLDDEIEDEEWEPGPVRRMGSGIAKEDDEVTVVTKSQDDVDGKHNPVDEKAQPGLVGTPDNPIWFWPIFENNNGKVDTNIMDCSFVDANSQQDEVLDLSSSDESGDEGDGDIDAGDEIAEEQEEIITTLSREDAELFAEVMKAIKEGGDLRKFKVDYLKTYLRHYGLRLVGVKFVLLSRIQEHLRIKDGRAEEIFPRSSFPIDCKGDVCLGDTVLFLQTVYDAPFDYEIRCASGPPLGKRWVAGKVVSESYGAGKQQHTFTIEVLWSRGIQPFYCMRPLKIKGRNLYRMVTMRQPWNNEAERQKVLDEKHARGAAARAYRRAVKGLKSQVVVRSGKSRAGQRVHPYSRPHGISERPQGTISPKTTTQQNAMQNVGIIHTKSNAHQGSGIPAHPAPTVALHSGMQQQGTCTEQTVHQTFMATNNAAPPTTARSSPQQPARNSHTQQGEWQSIKHIPAPAYPAPAFHPSRRFTHVQDFMQHGRSLHTQQSENPTHEHFPPLKVHVVHERSMQHGRIHTHRQVYHGPAHPHHPNHDPNHANHPNHQQGAVHIPCSNAGCEKAGAKQCITRSCGSCCSRNTTRGRCPRHRRTLGNTRKRKGTLGNTKEH